MWTIRVGIQKGDLILMPVVHDIDQHVVTQDCSWGTFVTISDQTVSHASVQTHSSFGISRCARMTRCFWAILHLSKPSICLSDQTILSSLMLAATTFVRLPARWNTIFKKSGNGLTRSEIFEMAFCIHYIARTNF